MRKALEAIQRAILEGRVCDDVAWFDQITTLYDYIEEVLHPSQPAAIGDLFQDSAALSATDGWLPIDDDTPRDCLILLYGLLEPHPDAVQLYGGLDKPTRVTGYWDQIDEAWCPMGSTWEGPWFHPTHWRPLPSPPKGGDV